MCQISIADNFFIFLMGLGKKKKDADKEIQIFLENTNILILQPTNDYLTTKIKNRLKYNLL